MTTVCHELHEYVNQRPRYSFPFDEGKIPDNGIYFLFEKGEKAHGYDRIVRIGTHTGQKRLGKRLTEHFITENKDRSIFRKNIGRAILNKSSDSFLESWEKDLTSRKERAKYPHLIDNVKQQKIEKEISRIIQQEFSFSVIECDSKSERMELEARFIATVAQCKDCFPSSKWLGSYSTVQKIREYGLWQFQHLKNETLTILPF